MDRYMNFDLVIDGEDGGFVARVIESPAGEANSAFSFPFSRLELENFLLRVGQTRRSTRRIDSPQAEAAREFGSRLYDTVFDGEVRTCFRRALDEADRHEHGLRLRIRFEDALDMADLPWEYLYSTGLNRFVGLSTQTPLVRYLDLPNRIRPLKVTAPLRILVMVSSPSDYPELDVDKEYARLENALAHLTERGHVELKKLTGATLPDLQRCLRRNEIHILHFIGHGGFDEARDDSVLVLESELGRGRPVSGAELGTILHDHKTMRLVVLNSCEGARTSTSDPFAGAAQSLVQQGIPAVIAMQFEISDDQAIVFAHEFYSAIADGYPVDAATTEARKAMFTHSTDVEWGTPVLSMRAPDGMVFDISPPSTDSPTNRISRKEKTSASTTPGTTAANTETTEPPTIPPLTTPPTQKVIPPAATPPTKQVQEPEPRAPVVARPTKPPTKPPTKTLPPLDPKHGRRPSEPVAPSRPKPHPTAATTKKRRSHSWLTTLLASLVAVATLAVGIVAIPWETQRGRDSDTVTTSATAATMPPTTALAGVEPERVDLAGAAVYATAERSSVVLRCHQIQGLDITTLYTAEMLIDGDMNTGWGAGEDDGTGESITVDFGRPVNLTVIGLTPGFAKIGPRSAHECRDMEAFPFNAFVPAVEYEFDDGTSVQQSFEKRKDLQHIDLVDLLGGPIETHTVTITILATEFTEGYSQDTILSEVEFWEHSG